MILKNFNTQLLKLENTKKYFNLENNLYAKLEYQNRFKSIKDRVVDNILSNYILNNIINENSCLVEVTSGNTGISLAGYCNYLNLRSIIILPKNTTEERIKILKKYNSKIIFVDNISEGIKLSKLLEKKDNIVLLNQFENKLNPLSHIKTAQEIEKEISPDVLVCGVGTGGCLSGISKYFKDKKDFYTIALEPLQSPFLTKGIKNNHFIYGIGANIVPKTLNLSLIDSYLLIDENKIIETIKLIKKLENIEVGFSSACNYLGLIEASIKFRNKNIITVFSDDLSKYYSKL